MAVVGGNLRDGMCHASRGRGTVAGMPHRGHTPAPLTGHCTAACVTNRLLGVLQRENEGGARGRAECGKAQMARRLCRVPQRLTEAMLDGK